jgi:hypothetical protein
VSRTIQQLQGAQLAALFEMRTFVTHFPHNRYLVREDDVPNTPTVRFILKGPIHDQSCCATSRVVQHD